MSDSVIFSRLMEEYGTQEKDKDGEGEKVEETAKETDVDSIKEKGAKKTHLMQDEERVTGSVAGSVYTKYLKYAGGLVWAPVLVLMLIGYQGSQGKKSLLQTRYPQN